MIYLLMALLFGSPVQDVSVTQTLAPHPFYFTVDGKPSIYRFEIEGEHYEVWWDGLHPGFRKYTPPGFKERLENHFRLLRLMDHLMVRVMVDGAEQLMNMRDMIQFVQNRILEERAEVSLPSKSNKPWINIVITILVWSFSMLAIWYFFFLR